MSIIEEKPFFIDFSQSVRKNHTLFIDLLKRDIENINEFFKKFIAVTQTEEILKSWGAENV